MFARVVLGSVASAVVLMVWGFLFWVVIAPEGAMAPARDETALREALSGNLPETGTYRYPLPAAGSGTGNNSAAFQAFREKFRAGPIALIHYTREGAEPLSAGTLLAGFGQLLAASLMAAVLLLVSLPALESYLARVLFVLALGVFAALTTRIADPIWYHLPWRFHLHGALLLLSNWLLAGIVLGATIKPARGYRHLTDPDKPLWKRALEVD
jgi:hypothetical protein